MSQNNVQYIVDTNGKQVAVILSIKQYENFLKQQNTDIIEFDSSKERYGISKELNISKTKNKKKVFEDLMEFNKKFNLEVNADISISEMCNDVNLESIAI